MKRTVRYASALVTMLTGSLAFASGHGLPNYDAYFDAPDAQVRPVSSDFVPSAMRAGVASVDEKRGVPTVFWARENGPVAPLSLMARPEGAARYYMEYYAPLYGLGSGALATAQAALVHDTGRGGVMVVFRQKAQGVDVHRAEMSVLMRSNRELVAIFGNLHPLASTKMARSTKFVQAPKNSIARAFNDFFGTKVPTSAFVDTKKHEHGYSFYNLVETAETKTRGIGLARPARVKKVYFAMPESLVPAHYVEIWGWDKTTKESVLYSYVIAADDGRMLERRGLTHDAAYTYRVWSDGAPLFTPPDGPQADYAPHPTGMPDGSSPAYTLPVLVTVDGFNTNPGGTFDPWLAAGATESTGNNVDAYADLDSNNNPDYRATTTGPGVFDRTYDTSQNPTVSQDQVRASITQLFFDINYMHDYWYDSGFNEAAGNAQEDNYGRGGSGNDVLLAEAQDGVNTGNSNNANMATPADGSSPRMQMYVWDGPANASLTVNPGNQTFSVGVAGFGPQTFNIGPANIVLAQDNSTDDSSGGTTGTFTDACQALTGGMGNWNNKIVLADRGACNFTVKVKNIQNAGGIGAIIANNTAVGLPPSPMGGADNTITIGTLGIT